MTAPSNYYSLPRKRGKENMGGMATQLLYAPLDYFQNIKQVKTTTEPGDAVTIDGSHVFKAGKGFHQAFAITESVKKMLEAQGELGGRSKKAKGEMFYAGTSKAAAEFDKKAVNDEFIILVKELNSQAWLQVGSEDFPAIFNGGYDSATPSSGRKGWTFPFEANQTGMQYYEGTRTLHPEALNSGSGDEDAETYVD